MNLDAYRDKDADILIQNVDRKFSPVFERGNYNADEKRAIYRYLFSRRPNKLPPSLKSRLINLYDPLADRSSRFPDGLRWCLNVYVGCEHNCGYCYVNGYSKETVGMSPHAKSDFGKFLIRDIKDMIRLKMPPAPLHMSNSTDLLQKNLEVKYRHTLNALRNVLIIRRHFTSIVILTKNPEILCTEPYFWIISRPKMKPFTVQITCEFWREEARRFYTPNAPTIESRLEALRLLSQKGIDTELRIDPLFPSSRIPEEIRLHKPLHHYSIPEAQTKDDLVSLIRFAKKCGAKSVIVNDLSVPISKKAEQSKKWFGMIYLDANPKRRRRTVSGRWKLPEEYQKALHNSVKELCIQEGISFKHCMHDVLNRK